jgi:carbon monoxide dehydrogenase subunit G
LRLDGAHDFGVERKRVWDALQDPGVLARAVPGIEHLESRGPDEYGLRVKVGVGSVKGTYAGTFGMADKAPPEACTVRAMVSGAPGSVDVGARMTLSERDGGCRLAYEADAKVTGPIAGVGQRLVAAAARKATAEFLHNVERELTGEARASAPVPGPSPVPSAAPVASADTTRVAMVSLVLGAFLALAGVAVGRWTARR